MTQSTSQTEIRLAFFQAVSKAVNSSLILEDIFDALGEVLHQFIPFQAGLIVILDESQNSTRMLVELGSEGEASIRGDSNLFVGYDNLLDAILHHPQPQRLSAPLPSSILTENMDQAVLLVPLIAKGIVIGCMSLGGAEYTQDHLDLLMDVSEQLAVALENARLYWQTQSQAGREFLINQITKSIRQSLEIQQILETTVQEVGKVLGVSRCLIHYWGQQPESVQQYEYTMLGVSPVSEAQSFSQFEHQLFLRRAESQQKYNPFILNDIRAFEAKSQPLLLENGIKSMAVFPILLDEKNVVGTISLHQCDAYRAWITEEIELLQTIAEHVAVGLHQANLFAETERQRLQLETTLRELQQTQMQLIQSEKMAVLGQFVAGIAHEVNTPLGTLMANDAIIKSCLEKWTISTDKDQQYQESALELLALNQMAGDRIQEIVKNLRNFARLDESDLKQVDLHQGLDATLLLMKSALQGKATVVKQYGDIPLVDCFPGLLNQVFMNLIVNALHSLENIGTITISTAYKPAENCVEVAIKDTGKGISPENLSRIFDPGFTTKGVGVGTGLGLALCYRIMEKHQGRIIAESQLDVGTTMTVVVPVRQAL